MSILDMFKLDGKIALVTGCRRGIGRGFAQALAEAGADIVGVSATLKSSGSAIEKDVNAIGRNFRGYACDFSDREALYRFIEKVKNDVPRVDILVNNAGTILRKPAAEHPDEALLLAAQHPGTIHLLVTDVVMPGMVGSELAKRLVAPRPEMKVLYISGYTDDAIAHHGVLEPGVSYLEKPFTPTTLGHKVREVLNAPREADSTHSICPE